MILAGDIGGTNSRLAIFDPQLKQLHESTTKNAGRSNLTDIIKEFLAAAPKDLKIDRACFGVAGPVAEGRVTLTNLMWDLDQRDLSRDLNIPKVALINDLVAHAEGIETLPPEKLVTIHPGEPAPHGNRAVIIPGTGLGEAGLVYEMEIKGYRAFASEGGHADFAPRSETEIALLKYVQATKGVATWERVLSGPGMRRIYDFFLTPEQLGQASAMSEKDPTPRQVEEAAAGPNANRAAAAAVELFVRLYGSEAGNLALKLLATGGIYLGGNIAASLDEYLRTPLFLDALHGKGPDKIRPVIQKMPVYLVISDLCALYGAANYARRL